MNPRSNIDRLVSASLLRVRMQSPFFATLALFARVRSREDIATAATNGLDIFLNPEYARSLPPKQLDGLLLHEVLHAALLHCFRRGERDPLLWNVAADIVVNGMVLEQGTFQLPPGALRNANLEHLSVEEVYELIRKNATVVEVPLDLLEPFDGEGNGEGNDRDRGSLDASRRAEIEARWRNATQQAIAVARTSQQYGRLPTGLQRELGSLSPAQLDWRSYLWRYMVRTPTDFSGFDRRFVGRGLYLEALEAESVRVFVAVDTSGSIAVEELRLFLSEVRGILSAYPHITCDLYYADVDAYGPYPLDADDDIPKPEGGGGTSFVPFFDKVAATHDTFESAACVYLTDGYGSFPETPPSMPVLWVVTPGGKELETFPFGEAVRLLSPSVARS